MKRIKYLLLVVTVISLNFISTLRAAAQQVPDSIIKQQSAQFTKDMEDLKAEYVKVMVKLTMSHAYVMQLSQEELQTIIDYNTDVVISGNVKLTGLTRDSLDRFVKKYRRWLPVGRNDGYHVSITLASRIMDMNNRAVFPIFKKRIRHSQELIAQNPRVDDRPFIEDYKGPAFYSGLHDPHRRVISWEELAEAIRDDVQQTVDYFDEWVAREQQEKEEREQEMKGVRDSLEKEVW